MEMGNLLLPGHNLFDQSYRKAVKRGNLHVQGCML